MPWRANIDAARREEVEEIRQARQCYACKVKPTPHPRQEKTDGFIWFIFTGTVKCTKCYAWACTKHSHQRMCMRCGRLLSSLFGETLIQLRQLHYRLTRS